MTKLGLLRGIPFFSVLLIIAVDSMHRSIRVLNISNSISKKLLILSRVEDFHCT